MSQSCKVHAAFREKMVIYCNRDRWGQIMAKFKCPVTIWISSSTLGSHQKLGAGVLRQSGLWVPFLQCLYLDKSPGQQKRKKPPETKNNCGACSRWGKL